MSYSDEIKQAENDLRRMVKDLQGFDSGPRSIDAKLIKTKEDGWMGDNFSLVISVRFHDILPRVGNVVMALSPSYMLYQNAPRERLIHDISRAITGEVQKQVDAALMRGWE